MKGIPVRLSLQIYLQAQICFTEVFTDLYKLFYQKQILWLKTKEKDPSLISFFKFST